MAVRAFSAVATIIRDRLRHTSAVARLLKVERCASQQSTIISYKLDSSAVQLYTTAAAPDSTLYVCAHRPQRRSPAPPALGVRESANGGLNAVNEETAGCVAGLNKSRQYS